MTKLSTFQIPARCLSSQDQISFSAVASPRSLREHKWHTVKTHLVVVWGRKTCPGSFECITEMNLENLYCEGFVPYGLAAAADDWHYLACSSLVRGVTFHECARISGMSSCTCTFTFWLLCMLLMHSVLWTPLFVSNSDNKIHSFLCTWKANTKEAGTWPNEVISNDFLKIYLFCILCSALARQSRNFVLLSGFPQEDQPELKGNSVCLRVKVGPGQEW